MSESDTKSYYVCNLRVRRELIPVKEDGKLVAYRCVTHRADGPIDRVDEIVEGQVEFENVLIDLGLMPKRNPVRKLYAVAWRGLHIDKLFDQRPPEDKPHETLLRIIR